MNSSKRTHLEPFSSEKGMSRRRRRNTQLQEKGSGTEGERDWERKGKT